LITGGPAKLWELIKEDLSNLKEMVIDAIMSWVIETVIKQATVKLLSMFNPVGAIIQAILAIYHAIVFIIEKASQLVDFVNAVVDSIAAIVSGSLGRAGTAIEMALAKMIPLVIGFLAELLGLGGISRKIRDFIEKVRNAVDKAIDKGIAKVVGIVKKLIGKVTGKKEEKEKAGEDPEKAGKVAAGLAQLHNESRKAAQSKKFAKEDADAVTRAVKAQHPVFTSLTVIAGTETWDYDYTASPGKTEKGDIPREIIEVSESDLQAVEAVRKNAWEVDLTVMVRGEKKPWGIVSVPLEPDLGLPLARPGHSMVLENRMTVGGKAVKVKLAGGASLTEFALKKSIALYEKHYGELKELHGHLIETNLSNFQKEYAIRRKTEMDKDPAADGAIRAISFGSVRIRLGYAKFKVTMSGFSIKNIPGVGNSFVPSSVDVVASK
jgi:hypothetical protein